MTKIGLVFLRKKLTTIITQPDTFHTQKKLKSHLKRPTKTHSKQYLDIKNEKWPPTSKQSQDLKRRQEDKRYKIGTASTKQSTATTVRKPSEGLEEH